MSKKLYMYSCKNKMYIFIINYTKNDYRFFIYN